MLIEEQRFQDERELKRHRFKEIEKEIKSPSLRGEKKYDLEFEVQAIENELSTFDREG